jgi:hypothetical protein
MQITLKDTFFVIVFCAVVAWCASHIGVGNFAFWGALVAVGAVSALFVYLASHEKRKKYTPLALLPLFTCCVMPLAAIPLMASTLLLFPLSLTCCLRRPPI